MDYHLENNFNNDKVKFSRFLKLCLREYKNDILNAELEATVKEWISSSSDNMGKVIEKEIENKSEKEKDIEDIIFDDCLEQFYSIEKRLIRNNFLITMNDGNFKWHNTKEPLIAFILILYQYGYFNTALFDQRPYDYRKVFEKRYNISLEQEFKKNRRNKIDVESYMPIFSFIKHPSGR